MMPAQKSFPPARRSKMPGRFDTGKAECCCLISVDEFQGNLLEINECFRILVLLFDLKIKIGGLSFTGAVDIL